MHWNFRNGVNVYVCVCTCMCVRACVYVHVCAFLRYEHIQHLYSVEMKMFSIPTNCRVPLHHTQYQWKDLEADVLMCQGMLPIIYLELPFFWVPPYLYTDHASLNCGLMLTISFWCWSYLPHIMSILLFLWNRCDTSTPFENVQHCPYKWAIKC